MLADFQMSDCFPVPTPMVTAPNFGKTTTSSTSVPTPLSVAEHSKYRQAIGALLYAANATRPDISYAVSALARHLSAPTTEHWPLVKRIFRYLKGTSHYTLTFPR